MKLSAPQASSVEALLALAIQQVNAGERERAKQLCEQAAATHAPHPAVMQLQALMALQDGKAKYAHELATTSLALRPAHPPTLRVAADAARVAGLLEQAEHWYSQLLHVQGNQADVWFQLALVRQDLRDLSGAAQALREVLRLAPANMEAEVNLGIVLQESGAMQEAMRAYGRAYRLRGECFGRIAHALAAAPTGKLWLNLDELRDALSHTPA